MKKLKMTALEKAIKDAKETSAHGIYVRVLINAKDDVVITHSNEKTQRLVSEGYIVVNEYYKGASTF